MDIGYFQFIHGLGVRIGTSGVAEPKIRRFVSECNTAESRIFSSQPYPPVNSRVQCDYSVVNALSRSQSISDQVEQVLIGVMTRHHEADTAGIPDDDRTDFKQLQSDCTDIGMGQYRFL